MSRSAQSAIAQAAARAAISMFRSAGRQGGEGGGGGGSGKGPLMFLLGICAGAAAMEGIRHELDYRKGGKGSRKAPAPAQSAPTGTAASLDPRILAITGGAPPSRVVHRVSDHFVAEFDPATKNPRWVCEKLNRETLKAAVAQRSGNSFKEEPGLPPALRSRLTDYAGWRYDRGHMAPAANHRSSESAMSDTFYLSNISPQVGPGFNRDYWARFEKFARDCCFRKGIESCYVVTGPVFAPHWDGENVSTAPPNNVNNNSSSGKPYQPEVVVERPYAQHGRWVYRHEAIGDALHWVAVPTHYYKVIVCCDAQGTAVSHGCFLMPNAAIPPTTKLEDFAVPLSVVESLAGLQFFRELSTQADLAFPEAAGLAELQWGREAMAAGDTEPEAGPALTKKGKKKRKQQQEQEEANTDGVDSLHNSLIAGSEVAPASVSAYPSILRDNVRRLLINCSSSDDADAAYPGPWSADAFPRSLALSGNANGAEGKAAPRLRHLCSVEAGGCSLPAENWFAERKEKEKGKEKERAGGNSDGSEGGDGAIAGSIAALILDSTASVPESSTSSKGKAQRQLS